MLNKTQIIQRRRYVLGVMITLCALILCAFISWTWWNSTVNKHGRFDLYFSGSVNSLSVGSEVRMMGQKIGQVETINLCRIPTEDPNSAPTIYAKVTLVVNMRQLQNNDYYDSKSDEKFLKTQIDNGLRAKLLMPSLLSNGLVVELFFDKDVPAKFSGDPKQENPEIPTISESFSMRIDAINSEIENLGMVSWGENIRSFEKSIASANAMLSKIDAASLNAETLKKLDTLKAALNADDFLTTLKTLDLRISDLNKAITEHPNDISNQLNAATEQIKAFSVKLNAIDQALQDLSDTLSDGMFEKLRENTGKWKNILRSLRKKTT